MRKVWVTLFLLIGIAMGLVHAETFNLTTGEAVSGELLLPSANDAGVQIKVGEGEYKRLSWSSFSQADLKKLQQNPKLQPFVEPFIEVTQEERLQKTEVKVTEPARLELPAKRSLLVSMFSSSLGLVILLVLYGANLYAAYEVSIYRGQPTGLVCGVSAVLPLIGPIIFLGMKSRIKSKGEVAAEGAAAEGAAESGAGASAAAGAAAGTGAGARPGAATVSDAADDDNPMHAEGAVHPSSLHLAHEEQQKQPAHPPTTTYQRGQFTFNRRFFETRFPGFFSMHRKEADKDMVLVFKTARGEFTGERITRIASNDLHLQVRKGSATEEVMIPFTEVQEIRHKHKDS